MRCQICNSLLFIVALYGCASKPSAAPPVARRDYPILYHRTGGIAGTDDRVVIWPDGFVEVTGKLLPEGSTRLPKDRRDHLVSLFADWGQLQDNYLASNVADAYTVTISYGDKSVTALDLAPNLPRQFRDIFTEIEAIAGQAIVADHMAAP